MSMTCGDTDDKELTQIHGQVMRDKEHSVMKRESTQLTQQANTSKAKTSCPKRLESSNDRVIMQVLFIVIWLG